MGDEKLSQNLEVGAFAAGAVVQWKSERAEPRRGMVHPQVRPFESCAIKQTVLACGSSVIAYQSVMLVCLIKPEEKEFHGAIIT